MTMMATASPHGPAVHAMADHVSNCLEAHRARLSHRSDHCPPLFVGVQGPQGSGKTFLTSRLRSLLAEPPYGLSVAVLSIDDLYLPRAGLRALAAAHPRNRLLHGRGQPGTHDIELGNNILKALEAINEGGGGPSEVALPVFDKSLFDGEGDRARQARVVHAPVDVVVLEGWCVGFCPVRREVVEARWRQPVPGLDDFDMRTFVSLEDVLEVNGLLRSYVEWWGALDAFIQIRGPPTSPYAIVYRWRLQQEEDMKGRNGGRGMTEAQVETFVDRYIPGYVFFGDGVRRGTADEEGGRSPPWHGQGLVVELDLERRLVSTSSF